MSVLRRDEKHITDFSDVKNEFAFLDVKDLSEGRFSGGKESRRGPNHRVN